MGPSVENSCDGVVAFLSTGVPEHHLEESLTVNVSSYCSELCAYSHFMVLREGVASNSFNDTAFTNSRIAD